MSRETARPFQFTTRSIIFLTALVAAWLVLFRFLNWQSLVVLAVMFTVALVTRELTRISAILMSAAMLLPFTWVFWAPGSFTDYRMFWLSSWATLPGLFPAHRFFMHRSEGFEIMIAGLFTLVAWLIFVAIGRLGRWWLVSFTVLVAAGSIVLAYGSYAAFRA